MRIAAQRFGMCLLFCVVGMLGCSSVAFAEVSASGESSFVFPGAPSPLGGPSIIEDEEVRRNSPEAMLAREESLTKYEGLDSEQVAKLASEAFPGVVDVPAGGPPSLSAGESIVGYLSDNAARVDLGEGRHGVLESLDPMAVESSSGQRVPIDLGLTSTGSVFAPANPAVGVSIPKHLGSGVSLASTGVSLTPVDTAGAPLGGSEGAVDGASVLYANTQTDMDSLVKPTTGGFEADTLLRSVNSPGHVFFRVGLPEGASLVQSIGGSGAVRVVKEGATLAAIPAPTAIDAAGTSVPVSMSVSGDTLTLAIHQQAGEYQYPIAVDPTVDDTQLTGNGRLNNWRESSTPGGPFRFEEFYYENLLMDFDWGTGYARGEWGGMAYETRKNTHIYKFTSELAASNAGNNVEEKIFITSPGKGVEKEEVLADNLSRTKKELCVEGGCATGTVSSANEGNAAEFKQTATNPGIEFEGQMFNPSVYILQEKNPAAAINTMSETIAGKPNAFFHGHWWATTSSSEVTGSDPGLGVDELRFTSPNQAGWEEKDKYENECLGVQCPASVSTQAPSGLWSLPNGEDTVAVTSVDPVGLTASATAKVKIDKTPPYNINLMGLPAANQFGNKQYPLYATAQEGSGSLESSGIASMSLKIDGKPIGVESGSCAPGPCTAESNKEGWIISGSAYATGQHTLLVSVTSNTGKVGTASYTIYMGHNATPLPLGPGSVNPATGEYLLGSTDASLGGPGVTLSVRRSYDSYHLTGGAEGPLGAQWSMSVGGTQSLVKTPEGSVILTGGEGQASVFTSKGKGEFESPPNSASLKLTEVLEGEKTKEFLLTSPTGTVTKFGLPSGGTGSTWVPASTEGPAAANTVTYAYQTVSGITEPTEVLGPVPAGVSCTGSLVKGCRALGFVYGTATTAKGNASSEWGEFKGRLKEVTATAWNPAEGKMSTTEIAKYTYDGEGRLRGEWDPRISPALETTYGYDAAGHVTALTPPGQQPWLFTYGTSGDTRERLISATRPSASTAAGSGVAPVNTAAPALSSTSPLVGVALSVTNGTWSNTPLSYGYQWEGCHLVESKEICGPIPGATSQSFTPSNSYVGYTLSVHVTASNSDGAVTTQSNVSGTTTGGYYERKLEIGKEGTAEGQFKKPVGVAVDSKGNVWVADTGNNRIEKFTSSGTFIKAYGKEGTGNGQFKEPKAIAAGTAQGEEVIVVADSGNNRLQVLSPEGKYIAQAATPSAATGIALTPLGTIYVALPGSNEIGKYSYNPITEVLSKSSTFGKAGTGNGEFNTPTGVAVNEAESQVYVTDTGNHRVQILKAPTLAYSAKFGSSGTGNGEFSSPNGIAVEPTTISNENWALMHGLASDVLVLDLGDKRVQQFNETGGYQQQYYELESQGLAISRIPGATDGYMYVANTGKSKITEWIPGSGAKAPEPPKPGTSAVWTVEYNVPVSGTAAPHALGKTEAETWGQKDDPSEGTAIYPPDTPMGWPAQSYGNATIYYLDSNGHTVNVANPEGGISTTEYNSKGDVERTLSADSRAAALKEGSKSAEASKLLDTENAYNTEGTELQSTLGPEHKIQLPSGAQVQARARKTYSYDEGAPSEGGPYGLPTKLTEGAVYAGKEEDIRETTTSYSGQSNLGWKLHKPTTVTTDPKGLKLVHTTVYDPATGRAIETSTPDATGTTLPAYAMHFGTTGSENGQMKEPIATAITSNGNVDVLERGNNRVEEFSPSGTYIAKFGSAGAGELQFSAPQGLGTDSKGNIWIADSGNNRVEEYNSSNGHVQQFGSKGTGAGQFEVPRAIAVSMSGYVYVVDGSNNNRIEKFKENGTFVSTFGWGVSDGTAKFEICTSSCRAGISGSGAGQFNSARGIAIAANGNIWVSDSGNGRLEEFSETGEYITSVGTKGAGAEQFNEPKGVAIDPKGNILVADSANFRVQMLSSSGAFIGRFGTNGTGNGQFEEPWGLTVKANGAVYIADTKATANHVDEWVGSPGAHVPKTVYYSAKAEAEVLACREHPEWAGLPCQTMPATQPGTNGLPELPVTTATYNMWDEPEKTTETVGSTTRTKTTTYDSAGRTKTSAVTSTVGTAVPTVTDEYNSETGVIEKQCANEGKACTEGTPKTIAAAVNKVGEVTSYTDADENTTTYEYNIDGLVEKLNDGKGTQTYYYHSDLGGLTYLVDSAAGAFSATYDVEGKQLTEGYPNGMTASYGRDATGKSTSVEYVKTTHCTEKCTWYSDVAVPSIHGQMLSQTSTLSSQADTYDPAGRLTQVQNTPAGKGCTTRAYTYDEDTNRTSLKTYEPGSEGKCTSTGGTEESHAYDSADRLIDTGVKYSEFGNITTLPAADAGGSELTSSYYVDNQLASETQNGQTIGYNLDPAGRTRETVSTGTKTSDVISHYAGPGNTPAWTVNTSSEWTRNISGIDGFAAVQNNGETPVLQLTNLHGDVIATAYLSETATALASTADTSEFGVPTVSLPPKYSWLGANEIPTELPSGVMNMGARSYVPQLGRFLQPDPVPGGSANTYTYTFGDPVNSSDPSGALTYGFSGWLTEENNQEAQEVVAREAAREALEREEAERRAKEAEAAAEAAAGPQYASEEEWEEWEEGEEEGEYEYVSYERRGEGKEEAHLGSAVLYQPLTEISTSDGADGNEPESGSRILIKGGPGGHGCAKRKTCHHHGGGKGGGGGGAIEKCAHGAAKGAVTGAAGGAAAGAVGGEGAGAAPGALAGAVGGAVAGCLSEVIP